MAIDEVATTESTDVQVSLIDTSQDISLVSTKGTLDVRFGSGSVWLTDSATASCGMISATGT